MTMLHEVRLRHHPRPAALLAGLLLLLLLPLTRASAEIRNKVRCDITQLALEDCPNYVRVDFDNGRHTWSFTVAGPIAFAEKMETYLEQPVNIFIVDYPTLDEENERLVNVKDAWFLYDATGDDSLCQAPFIYGFRKREDAEAAQKSLGGELQRWDYVWDKVFQIAEDWDRQAGHSYTSLKKGRRS